MKQPVLVVGVILTTFIGSTMSADPISAPAGPESSPPSIQETVPVNRSKGEILAELQTRMRALADKNHYALSADQAAQIINTTSKNGIPSPSAALRELRKQIRESLANPSDEAQTAEIDVEAKPTDQCGVERWAVKTLSDGNAKSINTSNPVDITVDALIHNPAETPFIADPQLHRVLLRDHSVLPPDQRFTAEHKPPNTDHNSDYSETTAYKIHADMIGFKKETDHDYHVVIADLDHPTETMIVEIVDPACPGASQSAFHDPFVAVRDHFNALFGVPPDQRDLQKLPEPKSVIVTGVRFFDPLHGQDGVAPNGVELHPVVGIDEEP